MIADVEYRLSVGISRKEIDEAEATGIHVTPLGAGTELRLVPSSLATETDLPDDPLTTAKLRSLGKIGVFAELDDENNITIHADLANLRSGRDSARMIRLPQNSIFTPQTYSGARITHFDIHVAG